MLADKNPKYFAYLTLLSALSIAGVSAWFSIAGLMAIFSGAPLSALIMGGALEVGKLVTASWLYRNWKNAPKLLKGYLTTAVIVLMFITSMGIFGWLSKAHIEQSSQLGNNSDQIALIQQQIDGYQQQINSDVTIQKQLDDAVGILTQNNRIRGPNGAIVVRQNQQAQRDELNKDIQKNRDQINTLSEKKVELQQTNRTFEVDVGPIKYLAALAFPNPDANQLAQATRFVILILIFVFDPLAVLLLIAANYSLLQKTDDEEIPPTETPSLPVVDEPKELPIAPAQQAQEPEVKSQDTSVSQLQETQHDAQQDKDYIIIRNKPVKVDKSKSKDEVVPDAQKKAYRWLPNINKQ